MKMAKTKKCGDRNCPKHALLTRGRIFRGTVIEAKSSRTAKVQWQRKFFLPKYERYENRMTGLAVHNPDCIDAKKGDIVSIAECRPLSKTKHFVITEKVGVDYAFLAREELLLQAEVAETAKHEDVKDVKKEEKHEGD